MRSNRRDGVAEGGHMSPLLALVALRYTAADGCSMSSFRTLAAPILFHQNISLLLDRHRFVGAELSSVLGRFTEHALLRLVVSLAGVRFRSRESLGVRRVVVL